jgi:serpin B
VKTGTDLFLFGAVVLAVVFGCSAGDNLAIPESINSDEAVTALVSGNSRFAFDLYREVIGGDEESNVFFSPFSISTALGMTYYGARGETASDMAEVLHLTLPPAAINKAFGTVTEKLNSGSLHEDQPGDPFTLVVSNGLWVQNGFNLLDSFVSDIREAYSASVENLDFTGNTEGSRETINSWVAENTLNRILNLIPQGILDADTRLVLTNAVYFKASWENPFNEYSTSSREFKLTDGTVANIPMMTQTERFNYSSTNEYSAVELGYAGGSAAMLIVVPDGDFHRFEQDLNAEYLEGIRNGLSYESIKLSMPLFEFTQSMQLGDILKLMGMESAFDDRADFSGITGSRDLRISSVVHKAFVKVDEAGTEAAAATAVVMTLRAMPEAAVEMNINRPFIFFILDNETGSIVFMGRVMNPKS